MPENDADQRMSSFPVLTLTSGSDVHLRNRHHAIFRTAVARAPDVEDGGIVEVRSTDGSFLAYATYNPHAYICGRAFAFAEGDPLELLQGTIRGCMELRRRLFSAEDTDAIRLINAEGDALPGLVVDRYGDTLVVQFTTLGMERLRDWLADVLLAETGATRIFEKSQSPARKKEGLAPFAGWLRGGGATTITVTERGMRMQVDLAKGQKTGVFLDQREMRSVVRSMAKDRTVLDVCSYTGGFSLAALLGGATYATAVDYDADALESATQTMELNGVAGRFAARAVDAFAFLRTPADRPYDFLILDPPAFAKRSADLAGAKKAYTDLNRMALEMLPPGGLLLTCSCSYQVDAALFQTIVFHAARQAKRNVRILQRHRLASDHPVNIYHPETDYLKSLLLWVT